jgi:peptidoglycan/xylan/chitin deacetylase (PgdA/CDA1 family)
MGLLIFFFVKLTRPLITHNFILTIHRLLYYKQRIPNLLLLILFFYISGCQKFQLRNEIDPLDIGLQPGIALTFDDNYYDDWIRMLPILDKYNAKATFFISINRPNKRNKPDLQKILILYNDGHEIGAHTMNHLKIDFYLRNHSLTQYYENEVLPNIKLFDSLGIYTSSFAYPYGHRTTTSDVFLGKCFEKIRTVTIYGKSKPYVNVLNKYEKHIDALSIKATSDNSLRIYENAILNAKACSGVLVLALHKPAIIVQHRLEFSYEMLDSICQFAVQHNMRFYRMLDL